VCVRAELRKTSPITVEDDDDGVGSDELVVTVDNVPSTVAAISDVTGIFEGNQFSVSGSFTDPGADSWTATVDCGDGSGVQPLTLNGDKTFDLSHTYTDNGTYRVTVSVRDDDMVDDSDSHTATAEVTVTNVAPVADAGGPYTVAEGSSITLSASAT